MMQNKRTVILIAVLFVAVLTVCIFVSLRENGPTAGNQSSTAVSNSTSKSLSSFVVGSSKTNATASSWNSLDVEDFLKKFKENNKNYQIFDFALSTCDFSEDMIETAASYYNDKQKPKPMILIISQYGLHETDLSENSGDFEFAEDGKIHITGKNKLIIAIRNTKTREISDCELTYHCENRGKSTSCRYDRIKREVKK